MPDRRTFIQGTMAAAISTWCPMGSAAADDGILELAAKPVRLPLYQDRQSLLWTYNGRLPGPEIRVTKGERVRVRFNNQLDEPSSIHWHGIRIDNKMDGVAGLTQAAVEPGEMFDYDFVVPDAGTYWYHAHNKGWNQVARGLYGPLIVDEPDRPFARNRDLTLVMDDWRLDRQGFLDEPSFGSMMDWSHAGRLGNWLTVNGTSLPVFRLAAGQHHRLRLINTSNARTLNIDLDPLEASVLALDGQPLAKPQKVGNSGLTIASAQRIDLLVTPQKTGETELKEVSTDQPFAFARFEVRDSVEPAPNAAPTLMPNALPEPDLRNPKPFLLHMTGGAMGNFDQIIFNGKKLAGQQFRETKQFWAFNGVANLADRPMFTARQGETILLDLHNDTAFDHAIHLHGHHFKIIGHQPGGMDEIGRWRDTILLQPQQKAKLAFVAHNPGKWLLHCHMLEHAAAGMNGWFQVV